MNIFKSCSVAICSLVLLACGQSDPKDIQPAQSQQITTVADTIFVNGNVYSLNWGEPGLDGTPAMDAPFADGQWHADASAIAVGGGQILGVGNVDEMEAFRGTETDVVDLNGATVLPGLIDSHVHVAELGEILHRVNLAGSASPAEAIAKVREYAGSVKSGEWVIGQGWDEGAWANNYPTRQMLDEVFPDNPVYLKSLHGFAVWVNSAALELANIDSSTTPPVGGEILKDSSGQLSGILLNRATTLIADRIPKPGMEVFAEYIKTGMQQMANDGFVAVHEAGAETLHMAALEHLHKNNTLPIRMVAMLSARDETLVANWLEKGPLIDPNGFLDVRSAKAYYDGALGSRGARLLEDYSDNPGHRGVSGDGYGFDGDLVNRLIEAGFQIGIHAIGDAGNREVLDFLAQAQQKYAHSGELRHRIEHAQVIHQDDFKRFKQLNLIASMEPPHAVEDMAWAEDRLGSNRIKGAYAWRTLRQLDVAMTFNSDLPGSDHNIFYGLHAALTRRDKNKLPEQGWYVDESVSIEEAVRAYTSWAAYAAFREQQTGVLKAGNWADLTVMNIDPFRLASDDPGEILNGKILMTMVNGNTIYTAQ